MKQQRSEDLRRITLRCKMLCGLLIAGLVLSPAGGAIAAGLPVPYLTEFPPRTIFVDHAPFSWLWFWLFAAFTAAVVAPCAYLLLSSPEECENGRTRPAPKYLWVGGALGMAAWVAAWTRFPALSLVQHHTFFPLWISYILVTDAIARSRCSPPIPPGRHLLLFVASSLFWWYFEYLNRFIQNWSYENVSSFSALEYFLFATLSFSTVLPAVASTGRIVGSSSRLRVFAGLRPVPWLVCRVFLIPLALISEALLFLLPSYPDALFPFVWISPTIVVLAVLELLGRNSPLSDASRGNWSGVVVWSLSGLVCGCFWELWNYGSLARWVYHVPLVARFYVFEMPVLGFAGYMPFGVLCGAIIEQLVSVDRRSRCATN